MHEQSKAAKRRFQDGAFLTRYFVGRGLDIGAGPDGLSRLAGFFPLMQEVRDWDLGDGDAQALAGLDDCSFDFVHSSHCLEHMVQPQVALANWIRVVRPGGHLVITVPDEDMYERGEWPSRRNADHKWTFTAYKKESWSPKSINLIDLLRDFGQAVEIERIETIRDFFRPDLPGDQTLGPLAECAIEIVLRRRPEARNAGDVRVALSRNLIPPVGRVRLKACRRGLMVFNAHDTGVGKLFDLYGEYSEPEIELLAQMLRPGDVAVDAGANIGALAVAMASLVGPGGEVHAFEPQPHVFRNLVANAVLNELDNLHCRNSAVGDTPGSIEVPRMDPNRSHSFGTVELDATRRDGEASPARGIIVPLETIDSLDLPRCRLIKADVEGMEWSVVRGARETIKRCRPVLYLEADREASIPSMLAEVEAVGYSAFWHVARYVRDDNFYGAPVQFFRGIIAPNVVAVPPGFQVDGMVAVRSPDWRADFQAAADAKAS